MVEKVLMTAINKIKSKICSLLPKNKILRSIIALAGSTAVAQVVTASAMPIVSRLYTPGEFGVISIFLSFYGFWRALLSWRYESALLVAENDLESHVVFFVGILCVGFMSLSAIPVLFALKVNSILGFGLLPWWAAIMVAPIMFGYGQFMMYRSWGMRAGLVSAISKATVARSLSNAIGRIFFGLFGGGIMGLFAAELMGAWGSASALYRSVGGDRAKSKPPVITWQMSKVVMSKYSSYAKYEMPSMVFNQMALALPVPIIASLYGAGPAGWYGMARLLVAIPNAQIGQAVADVFQMELAISVRERNYSEVRRLFYSMLRKLGLFGLLPLAAVILLGPSLVPVVFGEKWREMGLIAAYVSPWLYASLVVGSLSRLLSVLQAQHYKLIYDVASVSIVIIVYEIARNLQVKLMPMIFAMSCGGVLSYLIYLCVLVWFVDKKIGRLHA